MRHVKRPQGGRERLVGRRQPVFGRLGVAGNQHPVTHGGYGSSAFILAASQEGPFHQFFEVVTQFDHKCVAITLVNILKRRVSLILTRRNDGKIKGVGRARHVDVACRIDGQPGSPTGTGCEGVVQIGTTHVGAGDQGGQVSVQAQHEQVAAAVMDCIEGIGSFDHGKVG